MIGNDIVDLSLAAAESKWQHPRFVNKLFAPLEQEFLLNSDDRFKLIWQLWANKEAAYKAYVRLNPTRFYNPKAFVCSGPQSLAEVSYKEFQIQVSSSSNDGFVFSETRSSRTIKSKIIVFTTTAIEARRSQLRHCLLKELSNALGLPSYQLSLRSNAIGIPLLYTNNSELPVSLSMTHHGKYGAYSYEIQ